MDGESKCMGRCIRLLSCHQDTGPGRLKQQELVSLDLGARRLRPRRQPIQFLLSPAFPQCWARLERESELSGASVYKDQA